MNQTNDNQTYELKRLIEEVSHCPDDSIEYTKLIGDLNDQVNYSEENSRIYENAPLPGNVRNDVSYLNTKLYDRKLVLEKTLSGINIFHLPGKAVWIAAASIIIFIGTTLYLKNTSKSKNNMIAKVNISTKKINPGTSKAILTLGNGTQIELDSSLSGIVAQEDGVKILNSEKILSYQMTDRLSSSKDITYNTISTPRGGQYQLILPDGSKVWLNAESSIRFPTSFNETDRKVFITGEAYFEVKKSLVNSDQLKRKPFLVDVISADNDPGKEIKIEVLGTDFNVKAYNDETFIATTLVSGKVKINAANNHLELKPGQQGIYSSKGSLTINLKSDTLQALAWKNGRFKYDETDLPTILRQLQRWYNITINNKLKTDLKFTLSIPMNTDLAKVLELLERTESVHFTLKDRELTVLP